MRAFFKWILAGGILLGLLPAAVAQSAAPPVVPPDWPVTTAPVRFRIPPEYTDRPSLLSYVNLFPSNPKWANMPIRVFNEAGAAVGSDVISSGPGEPVTLVFDSSSGLGQYLVYLGSNWPPMHLTDKRAGVWLETRAGDGKSIENLPDMLQAWKASSTIVGRAFLSTIFEGGNRFGPQANLFLHFQGWFELPVAAHIDFAAISTDASFVLVDDKEVVEWPGLHDWNGGMSGQHQGGVDLTAGVHALDYYNAFVLPVGGQPPLLACLAAKGGPFPGWTMLVPSNTLFRPINRYGTGAHELQPGIPTSGNPIDLYFLWFNREQSVINSDQPDLGLIAMNFIYSAAVKGTEVWTFDDGTTAEGQNIIHVFPRPGMRTVKLTLKDGDKEIATLTQKVNVHPDWAANHPSELRPEQAADIMARDPAAMSAPDLASCSAVFGAYHQRDGLLKMLPAVCAKMKDIGDADLPYLRDAALYLVQDDWAHFAEEMQLLNALVDRSSSVANPSLQMAAIPSQCRLRLAQLTLKTSDRTDEVKALIAAINLASLTGEEARMLKILQADLALATGDVAGAKKQYDGLTGAPSGPDVRSSIRRTARIGQARVFMDRKDYDAADDALREVAWQAPIEKLAPDWALTRLRLYQEQNLPVAAYLWAKRLLPVLTGSGRSELLFRLTDLAFAQKDDDLAHKTLDELLKKHPYSEEAAQAKEKWPAAE